MMCGLCKDITMMVKKRMGMFVDDCNDGNCGGNKNTQTAKSMYTVRVHLYHIFTRQ